MAVRCIFSTKVEEQLTFSCKFFPILMLYYVEIWAKPGNLDP